MATGSRPALGEIYFHRDFYQLRGEWHSKYMLVLGVDQADDILLALLTSQDYGRSRKPACDNGPQAQYPGFYLGVPGGCLDRNTWVDLRKLEEFEMRLFVSRAGAGRIAYTMSLNGGALRRVMECTASAEDVNMRQERLIRDLLGEMP